ncbi:MAG: glycogen/starch/alpha-glucan phosphorylase [Acetobacteraceae bacterium]|jgi:starch phosphorylase
MNAPVAPDDPRARIALPTEGEDVAALRDLVVAKLTYAVGRDPIVATDRDWFVATALATRDHVAERWMTSTRANYASRAKRVYYLSLEFLLGRLLTDALTNLGLTTKMRAALAELGVDFDRLRQMEPDAALGNGGLGRLAACFMESMASLGIPAHGYGIRYNHGLFRQVIRDGWQVEYPENWLTFGNPWEFARPDVAHTIGFGGTVETLAAANGSPRYVWHPGETVAAVAYDTPVVGWRGRYANTLRLWSAWATDPLRLDAFNRGDHVGASAARAHANAISQVLYPGDGSPAGQELRLRQEYFFSSASLQDLLGRHIRQHGDVRTLADKAAIQLNDTHPSIAVPELMRLLLDQHELPWDTAWRITADTFSYTNHTLLPEALETWPVTLVERLLPRHMQIIHQINRSHLDGLVATRGAATPPLAAVSLIDDDGGRRVRMGTLAFLGSHRVNGVSALHTELMRQTVFRDMHALYPERIVNRTNGVTFRRWLFAANPELTALLVDVVGPRVLDDADALEGFAVAADDAGVHDRLVAIRRANKVAVGRLVAERLDIELDPDALFDVHIKRFHEYKRQLLNILETIALYSTIRTHPTFDWVPRVKIFAGKAAAGYHRAKLIIKLINDVARVVNHDPALRGLLKVVFLPDYNVSLAEAIIPASDLSEQISTAGMEASGTGNMKLALNGALTIGTLDGANIEIRDRVGADNIFIFGLTAEQAASRRRYGPGAGETLAGSAALRDVLDLVGNGAFSPDDPWRFRDLVDELSGSDHFLVTADFEAYAAMQREVAERWHDRHAWWRSSVLNTARAGWFSADRAIREYAEGIWNVAAT